MYHFEQVPCKLHNFENMILACFGLGYIVLMIGIVGRKVVLYRKYLYIIWFIGVIYLS